MVTAQRRQCDAAAAQEDAFERVCGTACDCVRASSGSQPVAHRHMDALHRASDPLRLLLLPRLFLLRLFLLPVVVPPACTGKHPVLAWAADRAPCSSRVTDAGAGGSSGTVPRLCNSCNCPAGGAANRHESCRVHALICHSLPHLSYSFCSSGCPSNLAGGMGGSLLR